jgi:colanic acid/amylovoran biosynthesis glycosyltransferase
MPASASAPVIGYLAPELPALSATFVHEELLGLERRGVAVRPFTVRRPAHPAPGQEALAARTQVLYDRPAPAMVLAGMAALPRFGARSIVALGRLLKDMFAIGPWRAEAWKLAYQWLAGARLAALLREAGCTHLHVHFAHVPTQIAMYACSFADLPFTLMAHANDIFERGLLLRQKALRAQRMLTISQFNVEHLRSVGVPADTIAVVRCGVAFEARTDAPEFAPKACYRIGTLCRLVEKKGVDDLLRALATLPGPKSSWQLDIAGDGPLRGALEALTDELGLRERVRFIGPVAHAAVTGWLRSLDVFVLACKVDTSGDMDGIPVSLMEAMSQRVPVISTRLSGIPELVVHERTGLLALPGDPAGLAAQLQRMLENAGLRRQLTEAAAQHVVQEFGQAENLDRLLAQIAPERAEAGSLGVPHIRHSP